MKRISKLLVSGLLLIAIFCTFSFVSYATVYDSSTGLEYELNGSSYTVVDIDSKITGTLEIPSEYDDITVKKIGAKAFEDCNLNEVVIPSSITSIAEYAFNSSTSLQSVTFEASSSKVTIKVGAFCNCSSLSKVVFPTNITYIPEKCFQGCTSLTSVTIPDTVTQVGNEAFINCTSMYSVTVPASVTSFGKSPFMHCTSLSNVTVSGGSNFKVVNGVLYSYDGTELVLYPAGKTDMSYTVASGTETICPGAFAYSLPGKIVLPSGIKEIGEYAFYNCGNLYSINIPDGTETIGSNAFLNCNSLKSITIPGSVTDYTSAFAGSGLQSVVISSGATEVSDNAFEDCKSLTSVTLPSGLTTIGNSAFYNCSSLSGITVPSSVTSIDNTAFIGCASPFTMNVSEGSYAEQFAKNNGYTVSYSSSSDETPDVTTSPVISVPSGRTINYKYKVTMTANLSGAPAGYYVQWFDSDGNAVSAKSSTSATFTTGAMTSSSYTYTAKLVDGSGNVSSLAQQKQVTINVKTDFFTKIISFISRLFGSDTITL